MIPLLDKTIVKITLVITLITLLGTGLKFVHDAIFQAGVNSVVAAVNESSLIELGKQVEKTNEATKMLAESTKEIERLKGEAKRRNERITRINPSISCPIDEFERMYNEISFSSYNN